MIRWQNIAICVLILTGWVQAVEMSQAELDNRRCLNCHGQSHLGTDGPGARLSMVAPSTQPAGGMPAARKELYVPADGLTASVHKGLACTECHTNAKTLPHKQVLGAPTCNASCHAGAATDYLQGAHAEAAAKGAKLAPTCATCHGGHDILPKRHRLSQSHPLNSVKICGDCHQQHQGPTSTGRDGKNYVENYLDSVHGRAVMKGGLAVAATCADCHGSHKVLAAKNPQASVNRENVAETCGKCHVGLAELYEGSVHGQQLAKGDPQAPVCSDCHTAHAITRTNTPGFMLDIVNECGQCHDKADANGKHKASLYETYRRSYHGQVNALGSTRGARCSDCHGAHDIRRIDDKHSRLNGENRVETCRKCHPEANAKFAMFEPHADHHDGKRFPLLHGVWLYFVVMMSFSFGFFGLHCILWFIRSAIERVKHGPHPKLHGSGVSIKRFNRVDRINHGLVIVSFFGLALTGLPLLYADKGWAQTLAAMFGGARNAGLLHRFFAVMLIGNFVIHGVGIVRRIRKHGLFKLALGPTTMAMTPKDARDCLGMFKWFFFGGEKPKFDRWTYWEKFDYMAEVGGSFIIGSTGLLLWFPQFFAQYLPGWMFNVATIIHGYEALLAVVFIFTIHFFNAHVRLEKFPVDDVMFTGSLPEEEFKHERGAEYERLMATGELEQLRVAPPPAWYRKVAVAMGIIAMVIGTSIAVLIILAGLGW